MPKTISIEIQEAIKNITYQSHIYLNYVKGRTI